MSQFSYLALIEAVVDGFDVGFPDLPTCKAHGVDTNEAIANGEAALRLHVQRLRRQGQELPRARSLGELADVGPRQRDGVEAMWVRLSTANAALDTAFNVYLPESLMAGVDRMAAESGFDRATV